MREKKERRRRRLVSLHRVAFIISEMFDHCRHFYAQIWTIILINPQDPCKPNFEKSGKLAEDRNTYKGIVIKYSEPQEARIPKTKWRLYPFKGDETLPTMYIHRNRYKSSKSSKSLMKEHKISNILPCFTSL